MRRWGKATLAPLIPSLVGCLRNAEIQNLHGYWMTCKTWKQNFQTQEPKRNYVMAYRASIGEHESYNQLAIKKCTDFTFLYRKLVIFLLTLVILIHIVLSIHKFIQNFKVLEI